MFLSIIHSNEIPSKELIHAGHGIIHQNEWRHFKGNAEEKQYAILWGGGHSNFISDSTWGIFWGRIASWRYKPICERSRSVTLNKTLRENTGQVATATAEQSFTKLLQNAQWQSASTSCFKLHQFYVNIYLFIALLSDFFMPFQCRNQSVTDDCSLTDDNYTNMENDKISFQSTALNCFEHHRDDELTCAALILANVRCKTTWSKVGNYKRIFKGKPSKFPQSSGRLYDRRAKITGRQPCRSRNIGVVRAQHWGKNELRSYSFRGDVVLLV